MPQEIEMPVNKVDSIEFRPKMGLWVISLEEGNIFLNCSIIGANADMLYASCESILGGDLPDYVKPMKRNE